ncbi:MAG TPA: helix-turn-helix transcriptional regulator [Streptosporangiaceae bacterium]|nr:helix-turn-helix transcriptional regulator [Streptosporangiaceae bacterium]
MPGDEATRRELGEFLRSRRARVRPQDVGFPVGARRRTQGLRREEVAVLAGLSPTWYTYLEQGRDIRPSTEVLDSLARVLQLTEDERRYMHTLAYGQVIQPQPLDSKVPPDDVLRQIVATTNNSPYPVYATDVYCDLIAWNEAATEWYDDWDNLPAGECNILHWMLTAEKARKRLIGWESDTRDIVARWRAEVAKWPDDDLLRRRIAEFTELSPDFVRWWNDRDVQEHRAKVRRFRHPQLGEQVMRIVPVYTPESAPSIIVFHLPAR